MKQEEAAGKAKAANKLLRSAGLEEPAWAYRRLKPFLYSSLSVIPAKISRRAADPGGKLPAEALHIFVSDPVGNAFDGFIARHEHMYGLLLLEHHEIIAGRHAIRLAEYPVAMPSADAQPAGNALQPVAGCCRLAHIRRLAAVQHEILYFQGDSGRELGGLHRARVPIVSRQMVLYLLEDGI